MNRPLYGTLLLIFPVCLSSCSTKLFHGKHKKKTTDTTVATAKTDTTALVNIPVKPVTAIVDSAVPRPALPDPAMKELMATLTPVWTKRLSYKTFSGKAKMSYEFPNSSNDFTANFRIRKDSAIWVNVSGLGGAISVARIFITPDSFFLINYLQKEITVLAIKDAAKILPTAVDFQQLQNLIVGEPLRAGTITNALSLPAMWNITAEDTSYLQHISYLQKDTTMIQSQLTTEKPGGPVAVVDYTNYESISNRKISTKRTINVQNADKHYSIDMNFVNLDFDKELEYPFSLPKNYHLKNPK
jgi:hypothetical protein